MGRGRPHKCPYCAATTSVAKGFRYNRGGKVRLRRCKACGRRWTVGLVADESGTEANEPTLETEVDSAKEERPNAEQPKELPLPVESDRALECEVMHEQADPLVESEQSSERDESTTPDTPGGDRNESNCCRDSQSGDPGPA